jgi:gliding motility-associated-like protein
MRNFTFLLFALLFSFVGYSQFPTPGTEGFENTTGPDLATPVATSPWTLDTGATGNQWAVFDNGVAGSPQRRWDRATTNFYAGTQAAFINRKQNGAAGVISEDYLATPKVTVPANGQLTFWTRTGFNTADAVDYVIKVNTNTTVGSQTTVANYTSTIQTWDNTTIAATYNIYEKKTVDLSAYPAGTQLYIAFVRIYNQPTGALSGNSWYIDDVKLVSRCVEPTNQLGSNYTTTTANLSWTPNGSSSWEIEVVPVTGTPTGVGTVYSGSLPYVATGLSPGTCYVYYVRAKCTESDSNWVGPYNFCTLSPGLSCLAPITVTTLPYSTTDNTSNYGDTTDVAQPTACAGTATNYMTGNDVFYSYTPTTSGTISITMTPGGTWSGIFVYQGCANVGLTCVAGVANSGSTVRNIPNLSVTAGLPYIIVISTNAAPQTLAYTLLIQQVNCPQPTALAATAITATGAQLSWTNATSTSWEYVIQTAGSAIPTGSGITTASNTNTPVTGLNPDTAYQYWVRADCGNGTFSAWAGPFPFTTAVAPPVCGGLFVDSGGQAGNYANNANITYSICPNPGEQVTVTFTAFNTQLNTDLLKVYNGNGTSGTLLATYSGTTIPPAITSSSPDGCLTFVFTSNATTVAAGWVANVTCAPAPACQKPIVLTTSAVLYNSVTVGWTQNPNPDTSVPSQWEVIAVPCGNPAPTAASTGTLTSGNPYTVTGLLPLTCYNFYVRAICSTTSSSEWSSLVSATTPAAPPICGGNFIDSGGTTGNYANNANTTTPICPINSGDQVTVTFTAFNTELNNDTLKVYNGSGTTGLLLGTYSGTTIPPAITSSSPDGCLTFVFASNGTTTAAGWIANVTCAPAPACQQPILLATSAIQSTTVNVGWTQTQNPDASTPSQWEVIALPCGSPAPTVSSTGNITSNNPYTVTGLTPGTCYDFYVRAVCSPTGSAWSGPKSATTTFCDGGCNYTFTVRDSFGDGWNGNTMSVIQNGVTVATLTGPTTAQGTTSIPVLVALCPGPFQLFWNAGGTFATEVGVTITSFLGDVLYTHAPGTSLQNSLLYADVTICTPPTCTKPTALLATPVTSTTATLSWTQASNPDSSIANQWEVFVQPAGTGYPSSTAVGVLTSSTSYVATSLTPGTNYEYYVRAVCSSTDSSIWAGPKSFTTTLCDNGCTYTFTVRDSFGDGWNGNTMSVIQNGISVATLTGPTTAQGTTPIPVTVSLCPGPFQLFWNAGGTFATEVEVTITSFLGDILYTHTAPGTSLQNSLLYSDVTICTPPTCTKPTNLAVTVLSPFSASLTWTQPANPNSSVATQWEVVVQPFNGGYPTAPPTVYTTTNPTNYIVTGLTSDTNYEYYVRAVCSSTDSSVWTGPKPFTTPVSCPQPTAVTSVSTSLTEATVSWTENGSATQWEIIVSPSPSTPPTAASTGIIVNSNPANLSGLTVGTFYDVYVRALCGPGDNSTWSNISILYVTPPLPNCAGIDLNVTTNSSGVLNVCSDNNCVNLTATYPETFTTSSYLVASTPYVPLFPFTGGTQVSVNTDDVWSGDIPIPFKFCFYGNTYNSLNIGSNGVVTFDTHAANSNCPWAFTATIPNTTFPIRNAIYAPYQDVNPGVLTAPAQPNINYQVLGSAPCRVMVINFSKLAQFSCGVTVGIQTSQVVLYETSNAIDIYVKDRTACTTWNSGSGVIGIQNGAGTNAVVPPGRNTGTWSATNEAWRFLPNGASNVTFSWLQNGSPLTTNTSITVCPTVNTNMTAQAIYTACDGTQVIASESVMLNVINQITPIFTQIGPLCQNSVAPLLPTASNDFPAITGTWNPSTVDTSAVGSTVYTFTPADGQCAIPTTMTIVVNPQVVPVFITPEPICSGTTAPVLPTISSNTPTAITGTWNPPTVSNTASGTYTFTPAIGQCASQTTLNVTVNTNCDFGSYANAVWLQNCSTSDFFNTVGSGADIIGPITNIFQNSNLGAYVQNSGSLQLKGAELKTFKSATANVCSARLNYRVYAQSGTPGTFQVMDLPWFSDCGGSGQFDNGAGPCGPGDQKWQKVLPNVLYPSELPVDLTAYPPGNYVIQVYYDISGSTSSITACDENVIIDNNGAYYSSTFTIHAQPAYTSTNPTTCSGSEGTITISGLAPNTNYGVTYSDDSVVVGPIILMTNASGEILISGLNSGTYSNFLLTINGCSYTETTPIVLVDPALPSVTVNNPSICSGQPALVVATPDSAGTYSYSWTVPGSVTNPGDVDSFNTTQTGNYSVVITNTFTGCSSASASGTVSVNTLPIATVNSSTVCQGTNAVVAATASPAGIYSYSWTTPSTDPGDVDSFNTLDAGTYSVVITDTATGCSSVSASGTVSVNALPTVTVNNATVCDGQQATITATPGTAGTYSYAWTVPGINPGDIDTFTTTVAGTYSVIITDTATGCISASASGIVTVNSLPTVTVNSPTVCQGTNAVVTATPLPAGTYSYVWTVPGVNPGDVATFNTIDAGTYSVIITNAVTGCVSSSASGIVAFNALPTVIVNSPTVCQGINAVVTATPSPSGVYNYVWTVPGGTNPGNVATFNTSVAGNYSVAVTNTTTGCTSASVSGTVTINSKPTVTVTGDTVCQGYQATISASPTSTGTYSYAWTVPSGTNPGNVATFTTVIAGTYSVIITDTTTGCSSNAASGIAAFTPAFDFDITQGCVGATYVLEVVPTTGSLDVNTATFAWQYAGNPVGTNSPTFDVNAYLNSTSVVEQLPLTFSVNVTSIDGCQQSDSAIVSRIYCEIQKGISPNNDGKNEYFDLRFMDVQQLSIYNRYGTKVYSKTEYTNQWVGQSNNGDELPDGTYYYVIEFKNNQTSKTGWIYINRENK